MPALPARSGSADPSAGDYADGGYGITAHDFADARITPHGQVD